MTEPETSVTPRPAGRRGVRMDDAEVWSMLTDAHTGILTTLRRDGVPISLPVWFAVVDQVIYVSTRGKKLARVRADSRASFLVEDGERWADLRAVHLTGSATIAEVDPELGARIAEEMDRKYRAFRTARASLPDATRTHYETARGGTIAFRPDARVLSWDNRRLGMA